MSENPDDPRKEAVHQLYYKLAAQVDEKECKFLQQLIKDTYQHADCEPYAYTLKVLLQYAAKHQIKLDLMVSELAKELMCGTPFTS